MGGFSRIQEVQAYNSSADFPTTGQVGIIYQDVTNDTIYIWDEETSTYTNVTGAAAVWVDTGTNVETINARDCNISSGKKYKINGVNLNEFSESLINKTINADNNTITELETDNFKTGVIDTDPNLSADSDESLATQKATKAYVDSFSSAFIAMQEPSGFPVNSSTGEVKRSDSELLWVNGTLTFTIQPKAPATSFDIYIEGVKHTVSSPQNKVITDTEGLWYFYFDNTLTLQATQVFNINFIYSQGLVAFGYWDATNNRMLFDAVFDERHGGKMDGATHAWLHQQFGTRYDSGLSLADFLVDQSGDVDSHAQFSAQTGVIYDEDLKFTLATIASTVGLPIVYHEATGEWRQVTNAGFSVLTTGTGRLAYNPSGSGLVEVANTDFVNCHVVATSGQDENGTFFAIVGQQSYNTVNDAREGAESEINALILSGLAVQEFKFIGTVIFETNNGYTNAVKGRVRSTDLGDDYIDFRRSNITAAGSTGAIHNSFADDDHLQYLNLNGRTPDQDIPDGTTATTQTSGDNSTKLATTAYVDNIADDDHEQIFYVGKHGSDSNDGLNPNKAFLTIQKGINSAEAATPTSSNRFVVKIFDDGNYSEDLLISSSYVDIDAPNAILEGSFDIATTAGYNTVRLKEIIESNNDAILILSTTAGHINIELEKITHTGTGTAFTNLSGTTTTVTLKADRISGDVAITSPGASSPTILICPEVMNGDITLFTSTTAFLDLKSYSGTISVPATSTLFIRADDTTSLTENFESGVNVFWVTPSTPLTDALGQWGYVGTMNQNVATTSTPTFSSLTLTNPLTEGNGGTGESTYTDGQLLIGKTDTTLAKNTLTAGAGINITNGDGSITITNTGAGVNQNNIIYWGGHGNNSNSGRTIELAVADPATALSKADAFTPTLTNRFCCKCFDAGQYSSGWGSSAYEFIEIDAPHARTTSTCTIGADMKVTYGSINVSGNTAVEKVTTGTSYLTAYYLSGDTGIDIQAGELYAEIETIEVDDPENDAAIYVADGAVGRVRVRAGNGIFVVEAGGTLYITVEDYSSFGDDYDFGAEVWLITGIDDSP
jgi:hypothetical protein